MRNVLRCGLAAATMLFASVAVAQDAQERLCPTIDEAVAAIHHKSGQKPVAIARTAGAGPMMILAGPDGRWTILGALPNGCPYVVMVGDQWETKPTGIGI